MSLLKRLLAMTKAEKPVTPTYDPERPVFIEKPSGPPPDRRLRKRQNAKRGLSALIIDDSPTIVAALGKTLRSAGYVTIEAMDAEAGIELAKQAKPSLIFLDIVLPGMNGFAALRLMRKDPTTQNIPIIMISGNEHATEQFYADRIGADDFMKKPFSRFEVFSRIEALLDANSIPRRRGWVPPVASINRPLSQPAPKIVASNPPAPAAQPAPKSVAAPAPTPAPVSAPSIPATMTALDARKELTAMGLQYFDQDQYNAALRRNDQLAVALFVRGGGVVANPDEASPSVLALAQSKGMAALAAVRKQSNE